MDKSSDKERRMKCVTCQGSDMREGIFEEEIHHGNDVIKVPVHGIKCYQCGEKYFDLKAMRYLERIRKDIRANAKVQLEEVGKVLKYHDLAEAA